MKSLSNEGNKLYGKLTLSALIVCFVLNKCVIAGAIVSSFFMSLVDNPNVSTMDIIILSLWGIIGITAAFIAWCAVSYFYVLKILKETPSSEELAQSFRNQFKLVKSDQ